MARGKGSRADSVRAYWREVRAYAERTGRSVAEVRASAKFRETFRATGKAPKPRGGKGSGGASGSPRKPAGKPKAPKAPPAGGAPRGPSRGATRGFTSGGRSRALRSYWDFVNAYAATNRISTKAARTAPGFQRAYERYREGLRDEERARKAGARDGDSAVADAKAKQLDALANLGMLSREEVAAKKASPKMRLSRSARGAAAA